MAKHDKTETTEETFDKKKALDAAISEINKKMKTVAVMRMGDAGRMDIPSVSTGILSLDAALGIGGLPRGRIVEIYGPEASGKTTVSLCIIASVQKQGGTAAFIDAEHALDPVYAKKLGVKVDELVISQPDYGEQGLEIADKLISSSAVDVIVIDSVAALVPKLEIEGAMADVSVGLHARMMSKAMRKLAGTISKTDTIAIFINQLRERVGGFAPHGVIPETTTGGRALKFYSSIRIDVRRGAAIIKDKKPAGNIVKIKIAKNKVAPPFKSTELNLIYGEGFARIPEILSVGADLEIIRKSGGNHWYGDIKLGKSAAESEEYLEAHLDMADEIEAKIHELLAKGVQPSNVTVAEPEGNSTEDAAENPEYQQTDEYGNSVSSDD